jgi:cyclohexyl-isocyanide hydratase
MSLFNVGFVIFPELTQLDFTGPQQVMARLPQSAMHIVAKSIAPVPSDSGLSLVPTHTFENCPQLDLICIPGGSAGVVGAMGDADTIEFVQRQARAAKYVTSVCTGAFILGAAGLLKGRRATTHWAFAELLPLVGATHEKARIVKDGNIITAGGVTSGIDFGLCVVAEIAGEITAQAIQLGLEYNPEPAWHYCASDASRARRRGDRVTSHMQLPLLLQRHKAEAAISPRIMPIPLPNAPISSRRSGGISLFCPQRLGRSRFLR